VLVVIPAESVVLLLLVHEQAKEQQGPTSPEQALDESVATKNVATATNAGDPTTG
jgi:hypothetical protein